MTAEPESVLDFWLGPTGNAAEIAGRQRTLWFGKSAANDQAVTERFAAALVAGLQASSITGHTPRERLALVIVLDQFTHHIHRDRQLAAIERVFLYLPLEHAESLAMQARSVSLYEQLAHEAAADERALFDGFLDYARKHRDVVARFGRFPHRNAILERPSTPDELEFLKQPGSRF
jgi:uncharacterized protein (DUF924 family)